jgi:hypothetical protein
MICLLTSAPGPCECYSLYQENSKNIEYLIVSGKTKPTFLQKIQIQNRSLTTRTHALCQGIVSGCIALPGFAMRCVYNGRLPLINRL